MKITDDMLTEMDPIVSQWIRERGTCMDGASYGAALELAAYVASRRTTPDREAWISVDEQFPEPGACDVLAWNSEGWCAVIPPEYVSPAFPEYTHWMPLPTAPNGEK